jgi:nucleotide-binding universal stress UspA family protein
MPFPATVIAGHDGTPRGLDAVTYAERIAAAQGGRLVVVHVIEHEMPFTSKDPIHQHRQRDRVAAMFAPVRDRFGSKIETRLVSAESVRAGLRQSAEDEHAGTVVVGPSHHGPIGHVLYGDVAHWLTSHCDCTVEVAPVGEHMDQRSRSLSG